MDGLVVLAGAIRRDLIEAGYRCGESAHFGGGLSLVDLLAVLYGRHLRFDPRNPRWAERDIFILSKGHGVLGYFATLKNVGLMPENIFQTFQQNGSHLIAHPVMNLDFGIESSNGSLGQGLSFAAGIALAFKKKKKPQKVYVLLGDGECNEGSVWEAAMFAVQYALDNLIAIVDVNGFQNDGAVATVSQQGNMQAKWDAFGWQALTVNGHDLGQIDAAYCQAGTPHGQPTVVVAHTVKGKGISFMENNNDWHHNRLTEANYRAALADLEKSCAGNQSA